MPTDIIMPQMGESIVEGTITKWLKKPGDKVQRDEPLFEISTDKVDAEIPAPASGVLQEIKVSEGSTVGVNTVVGTISVDGEAAAAPAKAAPAASAPVPEAKPPEKKEEKKPAASAPAPVSSATACPQPAEDGAEEARSSPLVRKIAREHGVNLSQLAGTGLGGRITKQDIMAFIERPASSLADAAEPASQPAPALPPPVRPLHPLRRPIPATLFP